MELWTSAQKRALIATQSYCLSGGIESHDRHKTEGVFQGRSPGMA